MKYYFFAPFQAKLCLGSEYLCDITKNVKMIESENQVFSVFNGEDYMPSYLIDGFPVNGKTYNFYYGKLFIPNLTEIVKPYKLLDEKTVTANGVEVYAKLYVDGTRKLDICILNRNYTVAIPIAATKINIINCGNSILFEAFGSIKHIILLSTINFSIIFATTCISYEIKDTLTLTKAYIGTAKYLYSEHYKVEDKVILLGKNLTLQAHENTDISVIKKLNFLQLVKLYGDYHQFLSPSILDKADAIKEFLGEFLYLIPPVEPAFPETIAAIYQNKVKYIDITLENGLIEDISIENSPK